MTLLVFPILLPMEKFGYMYILTNTHNTVIYVGITNDLTRRVREHKSRQIEGFTKRFNISKLVYYEKFDRVEDAIRREKQLKPWARKKKEWLICSVNPSWRDLYEDG